MPSTRVLASDRGVARGTVVEAYEQLIAEQWLVARAGAATRVAHLPSASPAPAEPSAVPASRHDAEPLDPAPVTGYGTPAGRSYRAGGRRAR